jgi:predicted RNA-binding protein YlqC (UPF0109 family)
METFLDYVVKGLVDRPDAVTITPAERNGMIIYELRVHPTDMGKIIGRQGATINAIRALLLVGSAKRGLRCALEVIDEDNPEGRRDSDGGERRSSEEGGSRGSGRGDFRSRSGGGGGFRRSGEGRGIGSRDRY